MVSVHQVAPASAQGSTTFQAFSGSSPGVFPSMMISKFFSFPSFDLTKLVISCTSFGAGLPALPLLSLTLGSSPSYLKTRPMDFLLGHSPTTHIGILGFWTGWGGG